MIAKVAFCPLSADELIADFENDVMKFDMSGFEGEKWIYAIGRTDYDALVIDSVKVTLGGTNGIQSVEDKPDLRYAVTGNILEIKNLSEPYSISVFNYAGQMLAEMKSNPSHTYALPRNKGLLIVSIRSGKESYLPMLAKWKGGTVTGYTYTQDESGMTLVESPANYIEVWIGFTNGTSVRTRIGI